MRRGLFVFILISFILHLTSYTGISLIPESWYKSSESKNLTQVEIIETPKNEKQPHHQNQKPIVKQLEPQNPVMDSDAIARFESERRQRVKEETKATLSGLTKNAAAQAMLAQQQKNPQNQNQQRQQTNENKPRTNDGDLPEFARATSHPTASIDASRISIELPGDMRNASATNLNTDASMFYNFYSRVEELVYVRWVEKLESTWDRIPMQFKKDNLFGHSWRTTITVILNAQGVYQSSLIERSSGYKPFDDATVYAFQNANYFPNVPKAKVEPDGLVRLRYSFNLNIGSPM